MVDYSDLEDCTKRATEALEEFEKQQEKYDEGENLESATGKKMSLSKKLDALGDLSGASASLCVAITALIDVQAKRDVADAAIKLTREWYKAARGKNDEINEKMLDVTGTSRLEKAFPEPGNWIRSRHLGAGSFGAASLYLKFSDSGNIINRVVVKDCDYDQTAEKRHLWDGVEQKSMWTTDHRGAKIPMEVATMFDLRGRIGSEYVVRILNWRMAEKRRLFRLYLEVSSSDQQSMRIY